MKKKLLKLFCVVMSFSLILPSFAEEDILLDAIIEESSEEEDVELMAQAASGTCGDNLTWELDSEGTLTISGTGKMADRGYSGGAPWGKNAQIKNVIM